MAKKKCSNIIAIALALACLCPLSAFGDARVGTEGKTESRTGGQTEIQAGVVVDYMGRLRFEVKDEKTQDPIPGASVEIRIPEVNDGEGAYVLFGVTDEEGALELDVAYSGDGQDTGIDGSTLYLSDNILDYQVYKADWLPYPKQGQVAVDLKEVPQVVTVFLHKPSDGGGNGGGSGGGNGGSQNPNQIITDNEVPLDTIVPENPYEVLPDGEVPTGWIPKTGVENYALFWGAGCAAFLAAAGIIVWMLYREKRQGTIQKSR